MQVQEFIEQFAELAARIKRIERWQDQWSTRDRRVQNLIANEVRLNDPESDYYASFRSGSNMPASATWYLPASDGSDGQPLVTNGSGALSFSPNLASSISDLNSAIADVRSVISNIETAIDGIRSRLNTLESASHTHSG